MTLSVRERLRRVFDEIVAEATSNDRFAARLLSAMDMTPSGGVNVNTIAASVRGRHRRQRAPIDPLALYEEGETTLLEALGGLNVEQLKDVIAEHGMDTNKLAMKWKSRERLESLIVTTTRDRITKGDAFRRAPS